MGFKKQFHYSNFGLSNFNPAYFHANLNNCCHKRTLVIMRGIFAIYTVVAMIIDVIRQSKIEKSGRWFIYFTSWNYIIVTIYFVTAFIQSVKYNKAESNKVISVLMSSNDITLNESASSSITSSDRFLWVVYNMALSICPFVVAGFWILVFDPIQKPLKLDAETFFSIDRHGIILALLWIEFFFNGNTYRITHFYFPGCVWITYVIFNVIYWTITGDAVYSTVDWAGAPGRTAGGSVLVLSVIIIYHMLFYFVDVLKKSCIRSYYV